MTIAEAGLPGSPNTHPRSWRAATSGLPGWIATASKRMRQPRPVSPRILLDEIELAHGDAARDQEDVGVEAAFDLLAKLGRVVAGDAQRSGVDPELRQRAAEEVAVGIAELARTGLGLGGDDLVAGGERGDRRPAMDRRFVDAVGRQHAGAAGRQQLSLGEQGAAGPP